MAVVWHSSVTVETAVHLLKEGKIQGLPRKEERTVHLGTVDALRAGLPVASVVLLQDGSQIGHQASEVLAGGLVLESVQWFALEGGAEMYKGVGVGDFYEASLILQYVRDPSEGELSQLRHAF